MSDERAVALQLRPFSEYLETGLARRFEVVRWFELGDAERQTWLGQRSASVRAVVTGGEIGCPNDLMVALPALGIVAINGVGVDKVDLGLARARGVRVTTTPGVLTEDVADLAVGLVIGLLREIPAADAFVRRGDWEKGAWPPGRKVSGRRFGIVGLGQIGSAIATRLAAFGPVAYTGPRQKAVQYRFLGLRELARDADVLVISCPANQSTHHMIDRAVIDALGPQGYLVNVSRGSVVDEAELIEALAARRLRGAALDVFESEPHVPEALRMGANTVLTPHTASATVETRMQMADLVLQNLDAFRNSAPLPAAVV